MEKGDIKRIVIPFFGGCLWTGMMFLVGFFAGRAWMLNHL